MKKLMEQIVKFGIVGGLSFAIDFGIYSLLVYLTSIHVLIANFFGFTISVIFNYIMSMKFVFQRKEDMDRKAEFAIFVVLSLVGLLLNEVLVWLFVEFTYKNIAVVSEIFTYNFMKMAGKILATGIVMVYNFISRKIFLEKK